MDTKETQKNSEKVNGKILSGEVLSNKMKDTITVKVTRYTKHPKYHKFIKIAKKYKAHDTGNTAEVGDKVKISETKPISKNKKFELIEVVK